MMSRKRIERVRDGRVRVSGDVSLEELYAAVPDGELYVEPLSATQPLAAFLAEGGLGFGSLRFGTFAGQLCRVSSSYRGLWFDYGLGGAPLYNVGYPLHRIMEGGRREGFGAASEMILRMRRGRTVRMEHSPSETCDLPPAGGAENVFFVNAAAARTMGLAGAGAGVVRVRASEEAALAGEWSKRFILDELPGGHARLVVLTQPSGAQTIYGAHNSAHADGIFLALAVHLGVLVVASAPAPDAGVEELWKKSSELPLTWRLGGTA